MKKLNPLAFIWFCIALITANLIYNLGSFILGIIIEIIILWWIMSTVEGYFPKLFIEG